MKLILSRKGFDSAAGGVPSPILPDGSLLSLPIPDKTSPIRYQDVTLGGQSLGVLVPALTRGRIKPHFGAHLDPDLVSSAHPRLPGWRPLFGQANGEQTVLAREGIGPGDLFLFFGWFRQAEPQGRGFRFARGAPDLHVLWGWLQVDTVLSVATARAPTWATYHPHIAAADHRTNNAVYVARDRLTLGGTATARPGAGAFVAYDDRLRLTKPGRTRSHWTLPAWFAPGPDRPPLGYHAQPTRWIPAGDRVELKSVARGQEFVLDTRRYPEAISWVRDLLAG
jgi:hypothetical protein